jgi:hypothetical protein
MNLSTLAQLTAIAAAAAAVAGVFVAVRSWRLKNRHWLFIPTPNVIHQDPGAPVFWVFPPTPVGDDEVYALVIAGIVVNAGPSDAFSVRVYAEPEVDWDDATVPLNAAIAFAAENRRNTSGKQAITYAFYEAHKNRRSVVPVLRVGEQHRFVVVAKLERGNPYLESLLKLDNSVGISYFWEEDGRQAHSVHVASRTILGKQLRFGPDDLCSPFERRRFLR